MEISRRSNSIYTNYLNINRTIQKPDAISSATKQNVAQKPDAISSATKQVGGDNYFEAKA